MSSRPDSPEFDFLIIGAGLAGSILAWQLIQRGLKPLVISDPDTPSASRAAAGLINPVTGQRLVLQENIDQLLGTARHLYRQLEDKFQIKLLQEKKMLRLFRNKKERSAWEKRISDPAYLPFIDSTLWQPDGFYQFQTGYLDTNLLLDHLHLFLQEQGAFREERFDYKQPFTNRTIFCEGWRGQQNPWFSWLPFQPAKGEILSFKSSTPLPDQIINRGKWLLPNTPLSFKMGATYDWKDLDEVTTENAAEELTHHLPMLCSNPEDTEMTGHVAGVRPGTRDKHPFIGEHPENLQALIFNGFGSKGSLLIPWYAEQFASHLISQTSLPPYADIRRYSTLYGQNIDH